MDREPKVGNPIETMAFIVALRSARSQLPDAQEERRRGFARDAMIAAEILETSKAVGFKEYARLERERREAERKTAAEAAQKPDSATAPTLGL